jgi:hypothetical protein
MQGLFALQGIAGPPVSDFGRHAEPILVRLHQRPMRREIETGVLETVVVSPGAAA